MQSINRLIISTTMAHMNLIFISVLQRKALEMQYVL